MRANDYRYFVHQFPEPQYLGAKYSLLSWLIKFVPKQISTALDAFAGSQAVAYLFKQLGFKVITNDFLQFNHVIGLALIANKTEILTEADMAILLADAPQPPEFDLMQRVYTDVFFSHDQAEFLDRFRYQITRLGNADKQALAIINRSLHRKVTMGHFGHGQALNYANDPARVRRNPSLAKPLQTIFKELLPKYNQAVFDNQQDNQSYGENILTLLPRLLQTEKIDLAYFDPPYCDSHANYQSFYHLPETYTQYWTDKQFINATRRYEPQYSSGFDKKGEMVESFQKLFSLSQEIPYWLISYNDRSYPSVEELSALVAQYKQVQIEVKPYANSRGGKGSVAGSQEVLFVCSPKTIFKIGQKRDFELYYSNQN